MITQEGDRLLVDGPLNKVDAGHSSGFDSKKVCLLCVFGQ